MRGIQMDGTACAKALCQERTRRMWAIGRRSAFMSLEEAMEAWSGRVQWAKLGLLFFILRTVRSFS